jgi:hypothetical protein
LGLHGEDLILSDIKSIENFPNGKSQYFVEFDDGFVRVGKWGNSRKLYK